MQIGSMFRQILEERIKGILISKELPKEFSPKSNILHFPLGCCCSDCIKTRNPIRSGEQIYFLYPSDKRKIGVIRAYCVAKYVESMSFNGAADA